MHILYVQYITIYNLIFYLKPNNQAVNQNQAAHIAPDCETRAIFPRKTGLLSNVAFKAFEGRIKPKKLGPTKRILISRATLTIYFSKLEPFSPDSLNP